MNTAGKRRLAVIGHPVVHSRSPAIHSAAFEALGLAGEWSYEALDVAPKEFAERVAALPGEGFVGANVTVPHKAAALELADHSSEVAQAIGAANTLVFTDGIEAENTDAPGFLAALPESAGKKRALVLGAGGSARAVVWALAGEGAEVEIWNRTPERAEALANDFGQSAVNIPQTADFELIVNCTAVGLPGSGASASELPLDVSDLRAGQILVDLPYGAEETELARAAREAGATVVEGLEVLVRQGAASFRIWTGVEPPLDVMRAAARG